MDNNEKEKYRKMVSQSYKDLIRRALVKCNEKNNLQSIDYVRLLVEALGLKYDFIDEEVDELEEAVNELIEEGVLVKSHVHHGSTHYGLVDVYERDGQ